MGLAEDDWEFSLTSLRDAKLLTVNREEGPGVLVALDAHPLLREYFGRQLRRQQPETWRAAHRRLYEYLCATTKEGDEPTLKTSNRSTKPWPTAARRGCSRRRSIRFTTPASSGGMKTTAHKLGAFGSELGAVACFFKTPWSSVSPALTEANQAWVLERIRLQPARLGPVNRGPS